MHDHLHDSGDHEPHNPGDIVRAAETRSCDILLLLVGFDGVLLEYQNDPAAVWLPPHLRELLQAFAARPDAALGIVSGRSVADLRARTGLGDAVSYVGLHGLEVAGPGVAIETTDEVVACTSRLRDVTALMEHFAASVPGVRVEDKAGVLALHTGEADSVDAVWARIRLLSVARELLSRHECRVVRGHNVIELLPNVWHAKAAAVTAIRAAVEARHARPVFTIYIGEDVPDDDAREAVGVNVAAAVVGRRVSKAEYHLEGPEAVVSLIRKLASLRPSSSEEHR